MSIKKTVSTFVSVLKFIIKAILILLGISLIIALIVSIHMNYYTKISLFIKLGLFAISLIVNVFILLIPLFPLNKERVNELHNENALHRKYYLENWFCTWCLFMVFIIVLGIWLTIYTSKLGTIVEIEQSEYIEEIEKKGVRGHITWYERYDVAYHYNGKEYVDRLLYDTKYTPWTINAKHSYVYANKGKAQPFWSSFSSIVMSSNFIFFFSNLIIAFFIHTERMIKAAGELETEEERMAEKKYRQKYCILLSITLIIYLYILILFCTHFYPVFSLKF